MLGLLDSFAWHLDLIVNAWTLSALIGGIVIWVARRWGWRTCSEPALKNWLDQLGNYNARAREDAKRQLTKCGSKAVPLIYSVLREASDNELKSMAVKILCDIGTPALKVLLATPRNDDVAFYVDHALQEHLPRVVRCRQTMNAYILLWRRLMKRDTGSEDIVEGLIAFLDDSNPIIQEGAALALGQYSRPDVVKALCQKLLPMEDRAQDVKKMIITSLGNIRQLQAIPFLEIALKDSNRDVRIAACQALSQLREAKAIPSLEDILLPQDPVVMMEAAKALGDIGGHKAKKILEDALKHIPDDSDHVTLREAIGSQCQRIVT